jgi:carboxyl-terminal processing protease
MRFIVTIFIFYIYLSSQENILSPDLHHGELASRVMQKLSFEHYKKFKLDNNFSNDVYNNFIESLDPNKMYFIKKDLQMFSKYKYVIDDSLIQGKVGFAYLIFNQYQKRLQERVDYIYKRLDDDFDYTLDEYYVYDRDDIDYENSMDALNDVWRKRLKNESLSLKISNKEKDKIKDLLKKRYGNLKKMAYSFNSEDVFQTFMNAVSETIDPHTNYFSPKKSEDFKINMSLSLEGIGALLGQENEYIRVVRVITGGPADLGKELQAEDKIIGVGQDEDGEIVDVIGWRVDDVVQLIRGKKETTVRLLVKHQKDLMTDAPDTISIVRDKVKLEEQAAKSKTIDVKRNNKNYTVGVIDIPTFYMDFDAYNKRDPNYKSTTRDVKELIDELKVKKIDGLIIDLRNNGGGSLVEAINLTGLFISTGPVVQVKSSMGKNDTYADLDRRISYNGPLLVLVNQNSASASEIFGAAIQDYGRGLIVGNQTYGKGTVQTLLSLDNIMQDYNVPLGQVKYTNAKFYRINGESTQHRGVIPDVTFPNYLDAEKYGESSNKFSLPYDQIEKSVYRKNQIIDKNLSTLVKKHKYRTDKNLDFKFYQENIQKYLQNKENAKISLNEKIRKKEIDENKAEEFQRENIRRAQKKLKPLTIEEYKKEKKKDHDNDFFLEESGEIIVDYIELIG